MPIYAIKAERTIEQEAIVFVRADSAAQVLEEVGFDIEDVIEIYSEWDVADSSYERAEICSIVEVEEAEEEIPKELDFATPEAKKPIPVDPRQMKLFMSEEEERCADTPTIDKEV